MRKLYTILFFIFAFKGLSQDSDAIKLSKIKFCELTIDELRHEDPELKQVKIEEMNLCPDGFVQDDRFENGVGFESKLYSGVIFQKYQTEDNTIAKIHLTREFKGYLPDGNYIDLETLKAKEVIQKYDSLNCWTSKACSNFWGIKMADRLYFYVKIDRKHKPQYPVDKNYYLEMPVQGIDIVSDCLSYLEKAKTQPLYVVDGNEISEDSYKDLPKEVIKSVTVLKNKKALKKYGDKAKNGVIEVSLKK